MALQAAHNSGIASVDTMLTGDTEHLSETTASDINRWLEGSKHLGETPTGAPKLSVVKDSDDCADKE